MLTDDIRILNGLTGHDVPGDEQRIDEGTRQIAGRAPIGKGTDHRDDKHERYELVHDDRIQRLFRRYKSARHKEHRILEDQKDQESTG